MSSKITSRCLFFLIFIDAFGFGWGIPPVFNFPKSDGSSTIELFDTKQLGTLVLSVDIHSDGDVPAKLEVVANYTDIFKFIDKDMYLYEQLDAPSNQKIHYELTLRASTGVEETTTRVTITVSDKSLLPLELHRGPTTAIQEELRTETLIGGLFWVEKYDDNVTYNLSGRHAQYFMINRTSGEIRLVLRLDRENLGNFMDELTVRIVSVYGQTSALHLNLSITDVNDNPPYCIPESYSIKVMENVSSGTRLVALNCSDDDLDDNEFTFEILEPMSDLLYVSDHDIHIYNTTHIDVEKLGNVSRHIHVLVKVTDNHTSPFSLSSFLNLDLHVIPVNEHAPIFTDPVADNGTFLDISIPGDFAAGTLIWSVMAEDLDSAEDGEIEYYISSANNTTVDISRDFYINQNGDLFTRRKMDDFTIIHGTHDFSLLIGVRDKGDPVLNTENELNFNITDSSSNDTSSARNHYLTDTITVSCQDENGTVLTTLLQASGVDTLLEDDYLIVMSDGKVIFKGRSSDNTEDIQRVLLFTAIDDGYPGNLTLFLLKYTMKACLTTPNTIVDTTETTPVEPTSTEPTTIISTQISTKSVASTTSQTTLFSKEPTDEDIVEDTTISIPTPSVYSCEETRKSKQPPYGLQALSALEAIAICGCVVGFFIQHKLNKNLVKPFPTS